MNGRFTVVAVQAAYVLLDRDATVTRVEELVAEAADQGAELVVLPEAFVPGTPLWMHRAGSGTATDPGTRASSSRLSSCPARRLRGSAQPLAPTGSTLSSVCRSASRTGRPSTTPCCTSAPTGGYSASTAGWCRPGRNAPSGARATGRPWKSCRRLSAGSAVSSAGRTTSAGPLPPLRPRSGGVVGADARPRRWLGGHHAAHRPRGPALGGGCQPGPAARSPSDVRRGGRLPLAGVGCQMSPITPRSCTSRRLRRCSSSIPGPLGQVAGALCP
jgi:hypothetical protein